MKNKLRNSFTVKIVICLILVIAISTVNLQSLLYSTGEKVLNKNTVFCKASTYVQKHGRLKVKGTNIVDKNEKTVRLKGVSSHGINWDVGYPYITEKTFKTLRDKWKVNTIRLAMYTQDYNGYCVTDLSNRKKLLNIIDTGVKAAKKLGMYVIIDWHVLNDQTPLKYQSKAKQFFSQMSKKYASYGNVLYEICNEPNGGTKWSDIKKYANKIIPVIRKNDKNGIIIVGTPNWSQDVDVAAKSPIKGYKNIMYAIHFYAATHGDIYRDKLKTAHKKGLPVICSEFGACDSSGNGNYDFVSANKWVKLMDDYKMGYVCWSLSNKPESASLLKSSCKKTSGFSNKDLTNQGKWLVKKYS